MNAIYRAIVARLPVPRSPAARTSNSRCVVNEIRVETEIAEIGMSLATTMTETIWSQNSLLENLLEMLLTFHPYHSRSPYWQCCCCCCWHNGILRGKQKGGNITFSSCTKMKLFMFSKPNHRMPIDFALCYFHLTIATKAATPRTWAWLMGENLLKAPLSRIFISLRHHFHSYTYLANVAR